METQPSPPLRTILTVSRDAMLLASRNALLQQAGYGVVTTMDDQEAIDIVSRQRIDGVVLGDSILWAERNELVRSIRALNARVVIIVLKLSSETTPEGATDCMNSLDGPQVLLQKLRDALQSSDAQAA